MHTSLAISTIHTTACKFSDPPVHSITYLVHSV